jgi:folate-dependent phosphoribosylglycinamide formyltransferase PurN
MMPAHHRRNDVQSAQPEPPLGQRRIVMLTTGSHHAARLIEALEARGIRLDGVVLEKPRGSRLLERVRDARRRRGLRATIAAIARRVAARLRPGAEPWRRMAFYEGHADRVIPVASLAADEALDALDALHPDVLVLGGAPILPNSILERAGLGVLNAHPGLLPHYRGVDVVAHAVLNGDPVGATVHFVDAGIDTGRIVDRVEVPPRRGDRLASLQERVEQAGAAALAAAVERLIREGEVRAEPQGGRFPLCRRLSPDRRRAAEAILRALG